MSSSNVKVKGIILYSAVSSTLLPDCSGKHSATLHLLCEDYSLTFPRLSIARYIFIQLSELLVGHCGKNKNFVVLKR